MTTILGSDGCDLSQGLSKSMDLWDAVSIEGEHFRLEDFILRAKQGEQIRATVVMRRQSIAIAVHPSMSEEGRPEVNGYLLMGDYRFAVNGKRHKVSKVYAFGILERSPRAAKLNQNIANERLKTDCRRLRDAGIAVEVKTS